MDINSNFQKISHFVCQESFVSDAREHPPRDMDIQMSTRLPRSNSDMGMEAFNKQV